MSERELCLEHLIELIERYNSTLRNQNHSNVSEQTIRTWINELLIIFGWNVQDINEVLQESTLDAQYQRRLEEIHSNHTRPDYTLCNGVVIKSFLDAKATSVDIFTDSQVAFQIRSYGWSAQIPCAFVSNFEQFAIYDTRFTPNCNQPANMGTIYLSIDEYIDNFDILYNHLYKDNVYQNNLENIYRTTPTEGNTTINEAFAELLHSYRRRIAENLLSNNQRLITSNNSLNYYTQLILDRIIFIRVCESKEIEPQYRLQSFCESRQGFWHSFRENCFTVFYEHYDGAMFDRDNIFNQLELDDDIFNSFIQQLYYPYPYKFDIIPVKTIARIYETFLGNELTIDNNRVVIKQKKEYEKANGVVSTPEFIIDMVCQQTIDINSIHTIDDLMQIKIIDPCCGSGGFLISCYEMLAEKAVSIFLSNADERQNHQEYYHYIGEDIILTVDGRRAIAKNCLYAVDLDEIATEVAKMSLALKIVDGYTPIAWQVIGIFGERILRDISMNFAVGNTLVDTDIRVSSSEYIYLKPFNYKERFPSVFLNGGFSYVVGNPPYVETKYYKEESEYMHSYLTRKYSSFVGKADLAVLFLEKYISLISPTGKIGVIIQKRWFKTKYGNKIRTLINDNHYLSKIIDFETTDIFKKKITYVAMLVLQKSNLNTFKYLYLNKNGFELKTAFENILVDNIFSDKHFLEKEHLTGEAIWSFSEKGMESIVNKLTKKWGTLAEYPDLLIKDGIQALWKEMYHLQEVTFKDGVGTGFIKKTFIDENGKKKTIKEYISIEEEMLKGVIYNKLFYPFKNVEPNAYTIFPYHGASNDKMTISEIRQSYPLLYDYLNRNKKLIVNSVKHYDENGEFWHTFTKQHNQTLYNVKKIILPMTAYDTIATFIKDKGLYMDNSNVWFIYIPTASDNIMKALTCIINSTVFSVLGKAIANPQSGGYYKFNKQFLAPIPLPSNKLLSENDNVLSLVKLYNTIVDLQEQYLTSIGSTKITIAQLLRRTWNDIDDICYKMYELTSLEIEEIKAIGRYDRIQLLDGGQ